jgi:poly-gamma-glutamate capsule biosynthesis protein CapA/YwtB (metallophosphatase superfamily)
MNQRTVVIVNPAAEDVAPRLTRAARLDSLRGKRVALVDNSKHNADEFLRSLEARLTREYAIGSVERYRKASPSVPTPPETLARLAQSCDALVHAVAD